MKQQVHLGRCCWKQDTVLSGCVALNKIPRKNIAIFLKHRNPTSGFVKDKGIKI